MNDLKSNEINKVAMCIKRCAMQNPKKQMNQNTFNIFLSQTENKLFPILNVNLTFWQNKNGKCHSMWEQKNVFDSVETHATANLNPIDE